MSSNGSYWIMAMLLAMLCSVTLAAAQTITRLTDTSTVYSSFDLVRVRDPTLPSGWFVQQSGLSDRDEACATYGIWQSTVESYSGLRGIKYVPAKDTIACGLRLASFEVENVSAFSMLFYMRVNFTNPESYFTLLNYGNDGCEVNFNATGIVEAVDCNATMSGASGDWKKIQLSWPVTVKDTVQLFFTPPFPLRDDGIVLIDEVTMNFVSNRTVTNSTSNSTRTNSTNSSGTGG